MRHSLTLRYFYSLNYFLFICFLVMTEIVTLTRIGVLPDPAFLRYSFWISSYPGILLRRPNTLLQPQQEPRHQARRYRSWLSTSAHIPQTPASCEETFAKCAFYYSILCWKKVMREQLSAMMKKLVLSHKICLVLLHKSCNPTLAACLLVGSFDAKVILAMSCLF